MKKILLSILFVSTVTIGWSQSNLPKAKADSLWNVWNDESQADTSRLKAMHKIAYNGYLGTMPDSAFYYAQLEYDLAKEIGFKKQIAQATNTQALSFYFRGDFTKAIDYFIKNLEILNEIGYTKGIATTLNSIGGLHKKQGDNAKALEYFIKSLKIQEEIGNKKGVADVLNNIGVLYHRQGDYDEAINYYNRSLAIKEEIGYKRGVASSLNNIGALYKSNGNYSKAIEYYIKSLEIQEGIGNKRDVATALNNIGIIYRNRGEYSKAIEYYNRSLKIKEEIGDKGGISYSSSIIGNAYRVQGDSAYLAGNDSVASEKYAKAIDFCSRALALAQEIGAPYETKSACAVLLPTYMAVDSLNAANKIVDLNRDLRLNDLFINFSTLSEKQKELYFATMRKDFDLLYDFTLHYPRYTKQAENAYDNALLTKGLLLKSSTAMRNAIMNSGDTLLSEEYNNWLELKRNIAEAYAKGKDVSVLEEQAHELEKNLVKRSQEFSDFKKVQNISWRDIQSGLKDDESAVEFVRFKHYEDYRRSNAESLYAALIIDSQSEHPKIVRLFNQEALEKIIGSFPGNNLSYIEQLYGSSKNTKTELYDLIWKPIEEELGDASKVFISPVGLLHKISFAALAKKQDVYLCDLYDIEMKSSTGKIVLSDDVAVNENSSITIFGGVDYNSDSTQTEIWSYLEGSLSEAKKIRNILKKRELNYLTGNKATESNFKNIAPQSNILHVATHGFFYPDPHSITKGMQVDIVQGEDLVFRGGRTGFGVSTFVKNENPLMRSGLALAGANDVWSRTQVDGEDGVLTAAEVATIDLRKTDLVVLSACETGLGDIKGSEGVYGLQRSFKMAGANYLIMSLWQVPDKETAEFMTRFYKNLTEMNDIKKSFSLTQKEMREKYDPYFWAAFVLVE